jgi:GntR family transcriptional regulator/MocR family aminotransferase
MLTYALDRDSDMSLYLMLAEKIKRDVVHGDLRPGERMPSRRAFATHLGVSVATIEGAYTQLVDEGFLEARPRSGHYVVDVLPSVPVHPARQTTGRGETTTEDGDRAWDVDFVSPRYDSSAFPEAAWARTVRATLSHESFDALHDASPRACLALRQAIASYLASWRGMKVSPEQVVVGAGAQYLYGLVIQLLGRERTWAIEDPGYPRLRSIYRANGVRLACVGMDESGLAPGALDGSGASVAHIMPSHQFPTGIVMPAARRYELLEWASEKDGRMIVEDDYDGEFRPGGHPLPTLQGMDEDGRVIYVNTFSRSISPSMRIAYLVLPPALCETFESRLGFYSCTVSGLEQLSLARFLDDGSFSRNLNRMRRRYRNVREALLKVIRSSAVASRTHVDTRPAGLHFLMGIDCDATERNLVRAAADAGVRVSGLAHYRADGQEGAHPCLLVSYAGMDEASATAGMRRLIDAIAPTVSDGDPTGRTA